MPSWLRDEEDDDHDLEASIPLIVADSSSDEAPSTIATESTSTGTRVGILGGSGSGKTTYMAALHIAALNDRSGQWKVVGLNDDSKEFRKNNGLQKGVFPPGTQAVKDYHFAISGKLTQHALDHLFDVVGNPREVSFDLNFRDYAGGHLLKAKEDDNLWKYLSAVQGLVYLFDPEMEQTNTPNYAYLDSAAESLHSTLRRTGRLKNDRLPHYLAICVTKFDEPAVFKRIQEANLVTAKDPPQVSNAQKVFELFAQQNTVRTIENFFHKRQVRYFVSSSVGFYTERSRKFDRSDCCNIIETPDGGRIRGEIAPINVFAPLLWIDSQVRPR